MATREPGRGRYAHPEREQRWLLRAMPDGLASPRSIRDRYLDGTRLRLRRVEDDGGELTFRLGQKVRADESSPELVQLTNMYLSRDEYDVLAALPAVELHKTRWTLRRDGRTFAIDEFGGVLAGLVLAELELPLDAPPVPLPDPEWVDVTLDDRFSGGSLARRSVTSPGWTSNQEK